MRLLVTIALVAGGILAGGVDAAQAAPKHGTWRACKIVVQGGTVNGHQVYDRSVGWSPCKQYNMK